MSFPGVLQMLRKYMVDRMPPSQSLKSPVGQQVLALTAQVRLTEPCTVPAVSPPAESFALPWSPLFSTVRLWTFMQIYF